MALLQKHQPNECTVSGSYFAQTLLLHVHNRLKRLIDERSYQEGILEGFDISEEVVECVLQRVEDEILGQLLVHDTHLGAHSL